MHVGMLHLKYEYDIAVLVHVAVLIYEKRGSQSGDILDDVINFK